jgi:hypothetical protein
MEGKFAVREMKGLTPGIEPSVSNEVFALGGRNYTFNSKGVKSSFGNRLLSAVPIGLPQNVQGVRLRLRGGDRCFTFAGDGIREWDETAGGWRIIYETVDTTLQPYRWTFEYLAGWLYFAHPSVGLLALNLDTGVCYRHEEVGVATPTQVIAVSLNNGRLGVLTTTTLSWSAASNGLNFSPSLGGAGAQVLAERVPGDAVMVTSYARGFMVWTTGGVMRSEFTGDTSVYRHRTLNTEYRPMNSFCIARVDIDTVVVLDERGLFMTQGEALKAYAPLFNEFLIEFLQERNYRFYDSVRIEWDDLQKQLYLSYSDTYASPLYEKAFVYYPPLDKWGEFTETHYGILPWLIPDSEREDDYFGFVDASGLPRYWLTTGSRESFPVYADVSNLFQPTIQRSVQMASDEGVRFMPSAGRLRGFDPQTHIAAITREGYHAQGSTTPVTPTLESLDALIRFGLFRLASDGVADATCEINSVVIRSVQSGDEDVVQEDYNTIPDGEDEDYNDLPDQAEDLGVSPLNYVNHTFELIGTKDGDTDFVRVAPIMTHFERAARFYACTVPGVWHIAEVGASSVGESFHITTFELTGSLAGRLL